MYIYIYLINREIFKFFKNYINHKNITYHNDESKETTSC